MNPNTWTEEELEILTRVAPAGSRAVSDALAEAGYDREPPGVQKKAARMGVPRWRRLTDDAVPSAKSVFQFAGQGTVAKATHAGLPWLHHIRRKCPGAHFWPFDGWQMPPGASVLAEVHPRLWKGSYAVDGLTPAQQNAFTVASWLRDADMDGRLTAALCPALPPAVAATGQVEGWILGVELDPTLRRQSR